MTFLARMTSVCPVAVGIRDLLSFGPFVAATPYEACLARHIGRCLLLLSVKLGPTACARSESHNRRIMNTPHERTSAVARGNPPPPFLTIDSTRRLRTGREMPVL